MGKRKRGNNFGKWLIFSVSMLFALYGAFLGTLLLFGVDKQATLTSYRQEYGERNEVIPNRYTYLFGYAFTVEGKTYHGTGQRVASPVFLKPSAESTISIRYLPCCPYLNSHVEGKETWKSSLIFLGIGVILLLFFRKM
ncbi:MAG TPA: hypothetical protein PLH60_06935 [Proteiniphilum sp.]|nr:hypothetical protein [Proteiniphilum sp.]HPJ50354.1 hypothetical protein [Proteiniphilum sp.]HPR20273.1 hypothetical protein [Proteiniphilum sp.]